MRARTALAALALAAALGLAGCAGMSPLGRPPAPAAGGGSSAGPARGRPAPTTTPAAAAADSAPSPEALAVLGTIPEPLPAAERVPAPVPAPRDTSVAHPDSLAADSAARGGESVPVPEPTVPLGERPGGAAAIPESALVAPPAVPPEARSARPDSAASGSPCWRLQVGAPPEKAKAQAVLEAATSQLLVPFVIVHDKTRWKVRTRDCLTRREVDALKARATASGFGGAFALGDGKTP